MFRKAFLTLVLVVFAGLVSGCAAIAVGVMVAVEDDENEKLSTGVIEVGEIKTKPGVNISSIKTAKISSAIFQKDMVTIDPSPRQSDNKVNATITEEIRMTLNFSVNNSSPTVARLKTLYYDEISMWGFSSYYYGNVTERNTLGLAQQLGIKKIVNTHFMLEQGNSMVLEIRGLWIGGDKANEITGARQLAREMANAVLKKLNSPASRKASVAEAKKD